MADTETTRRLVTEFWAAMRANDWAAAALFADDYVLHQVLDVVFRGVARPQQHE